jgi:hypothetical protein
MDKDTLETFSEELGVVSRLVVSMKARVDDALVDREEGLDRVTRDLREATAAVKDALGSRSVEDMMGIRDGDDRNAEAQTVAEYLRDVPVSKRYDDEVTVTWPEDLSDRHPTWVKEADRSILTFLASAGEAVTVERIEAALKLPRVTCLRLLGALESDGKVAVVTRISAHGERPEELYELADEGAVETPTAAEDRDPDVDARQAILKVIADRDGALPLHEIAESLALSVLVAEGLLRGLVADGKVVVVDADGIGPKYDLAAFAGKHEAPEWPNVSAEAPTVHLRMLVPEVAALLRDVYSRPSLTPDGVHPAAVAAASAEGLVGVNGGFLYLTSQGFQALTDHDKAVAEENKVPAEEGVTYAHAPGKSTYTLSKQFDVRINNDEACILSALDEPKTTDLLSEAAALARIPWSTLDRLQELQLLWIGGDEIIYRTSLGHRALRNLERAEAAERAPDQDAAMDNAFAVVADTRSRLPHHGPGVRRYDDWEDDGEPS